TPFNIVTLIPISWWPPLEPWMRKFGSTKARSTRNWVILMQPSSIRFGSFAPLMAKDCERQLALLSQSRAVGSTQMARNNAISKRGVATRLSTKPGLATDRDQVEMVDGFRDDDV